MNDAEQEESHREKVLEKHTLKRLIEELDEKTAVDGHSTTLVTLIIPPGTPVSDITELIRQELSTASRIKSRTTRKSVLAALSSIQNRLKYWRQIPENGLIIYCGIVQDGRMEYHEIIPPKPVTIKKYLCDSRFDTSVLKEMLGEEEKYGIILVEREGATFGVLDGTRLYVIKELRSYIPPKHRKGGQSARRFERLIEIAYQDFIKKVANEANKVFLDMDIKGLIIGGPGFAKDALAASDELDYRLRNKIIGKVSTQYLSEEGLREAVEEARELIKESRYSKEKELLDKLMGLLARNPEMLAIGFNEVNRALYEGKVETLILSEDLRGEIIKITCDGCDMDPIEMYVADEFEKNKAEERAQKICSACGGMPNIEQVHKDITEYLIRRARSISARVEFISSGGEIGAIFMNTFKGIVAILRYS